MDLIINALRESRPNLSKGSVSTYASLLKTLHKNIFGSAPIDVANFNDVAKIRPFFKDRSPTQSKTTLSALVVLTDNDRYRDMMMEQIQKNTDTTNNQQKTSKQLSSWISGDDIRSVFNSMIKPVDTLFKKSKTVKLSLTELQIIQQFVILALMGGLFIPPRRAMDYTHMRNPSFKGIPPDKNTDNHIVGNSLVFNQYKTSKFYGTQKVEMDKKLKGILNKWTKINPFEWLFFSGNGKQLNSITFGQRINKMFSKKVGVNGLRHTYLTEKYEHVSRQQQEMKTDMTDMGSSLNQSNTYIKLD
jgi:hypothetical protein